MAPRIQPKQQPTRRSTRQAPSEPEPDDGAVPKEPLGANTDSQDAATEGSKVNDRNAPQDSLGNEGSGFNQPTSNAPSINTPVRRPVQRLDSLKRRNVSAASSSSTAGGLLGSRPTGLKFQPKAVTRRTKEEREAQEKVEEEKRQARYAANPIINSGKHRGQYARGGKVGGPTRGGFRGGMSGWRTERRGLGQATGPLSGGPTTDQFPSRAGRGGRSGAIISGSIHADVSGSTSPTLTKVKKEPALKAERDQGAATNGMRKPSRKSKETKVKVEDFTTTYISSDAEVDELEGPRINIEHINLISDEDSEDDPVTSKGKERQRSIRPAGWNLKPIRLDRHEHVERHVGVNTDVSLMTSAQLRQKANERSEAEGALFLSQDEDVEMVKTKPKKVKSKGKDVEFVRDERRWKGVYQDEEDTHELKKVKEEPFDDDVMAFDAALNMATNGEASLTAQEESTPRTILHNSSGGPEEDKEPHSTKIKRRRRSAFRSTKPVLQTEEDRQEWERYEDNIIALSEELGDLDTVSTPALAPTSLDEDVNMDIDEEEKKDRRRGLVYLFQLPPIVPDLVDPVKAAEVEETPEQRALAVPGKDTQKSTSAVKKTEAVIKIEDGSHRQIDEKVANAFMAEDIDDFMGSVGKLSIYHSGYIGISWGGIEHDLNRGSEGELLQELVISDVARIKREPGSMDEDDGKVIRTGTAMGQMTGGFVVTPNWTSLFDG
ncbi:hypothetical protein MMC18_008889 [Xylographa bjoerkii]|nr:hypothetical protein [Xylographa bjoerkii]MCJ1395994.1 hypothetical protein [Xylographa bjoerkii]MCJ1396003.1 hypothetical protein [Xylographa bjoerkii]